MANYFSQNIQLLSVTNQVKIITWTLTQEELGQLDADIVGIETRIGLLDNCLNEIKLLIEDGHTEIGQDKFMHEVSKYFMESNYQTQNSTQIIE